MKPDVVEVEIPDVVIPAEDGGTVRARILIWFAPDKKIVDPQALADACSLDYPPLAPEEYCGALAAALNSLLEPDTVCVEVRIPLRGGTAKYRCAIIRSTA